MLNKSLKKKLRDNFYREILPIFSNTCDTKANISSSNNGPVTSAREINGSFGKAVKAIASAIGKFQARVDVENQDLS
ncbi:hypothetical protein LB465_06350 [Salegentibacter sp. LM13S]|uniref:hypothetical protein n=1 Tax=Salegentibacter lacus TaxID=2873599 RepID=UPI001CC9DD34|nr:hypothetical protein [Salegentibacter lacus]MBZ9630396.1 hypothetical protein [Salegentibacter lacus]